MSLFLSANLSSCCSCPPVNKLLLCTIDLSIRLLLLLACPSIYFSYRSDQPSGYYCRCKKKAVVTVGLSIRMLFGLSHDVFTVACPPGCFHCWLSIRILLLLACPSRCCYIRPVHQDVVTVGLSIRMLLLSACPVGYCYC
jgi:hypothetical protein